MSYVAKEENGLLRVTFSFNLKLTGWIKKTIPIQSRYYSTVEKEWTFSNPVEFPRILRELDIQFPGEAEAEQERQNARDSRSRKKEQQERKKEEGGSNGGYKQAYEPSRPITGTRDAYSTLYLTRDVPDEVLRAAYKALCLLFHPDKNQNKDTTKEMQSINAAMDTIKGQRGLT